MLHLHLNAPSNGFAPGAVLEGVAGWRQHEPPRKAAVRLFWYTDGKGTQDLGLADEQILSGGGMDCEEAFSLRVPEQPYSCSGMLVAIRWAVELLLNDGEEATRVNITVSPWVEEPRLTKLTVDDPLLKFQVQSW